MSSKEKQDKSDDEASRPSEESSSSFTDFNNDKTRTFELNSAAAAVAVSISESSLSPTSPSIETDEMKRAIAKKLIERYFYQLSDGCGNPKCTNKNCASSGDVEQLTPNQAAARALQLYSEEAELCELHPSKIPRKADHNTIDNNVAAAQSSSANQLSDGSTKQIDNILLATTSKNIPQTSSSSSSSPPSSSSSSSQSSASTSTTNNKQTTSIAEPIVYLDEEKIDQLLDECKKNDNYAPLIRIIGKCFSSRDSVVQSFQKCSSTHIDAMLEKVPKDLKTLKKEDFRTLEGDLDKDEDSSAEMVEEIREPHYTTVDLISLRRTMHKLYESSVRVFEPLNNALHTLAIRLSLDSRFTKQKNELEDIITAFVIMFEIVGIGSSEFLEIAFPSIVQAVTRLPTWAQGRLAWIWAVHCKDNIKLMVQTLQQMISLQVIGNTYSQHLIVQDNEVIVSATKVLKILYYSNILAGTVESSKYREDDPTNDDTTENERGEDEIFFGYNSSKQFNKPQEEDDSLSAELKVDVLDCRKPLIPFEEFYNEPLSDVIEMDSDYLNYKDRKREKRAGLSKFSFMLCSFILTPATKTLGLYYDSRIRMYSERRFNIFSTQVGQPLNPYLKLRVRREQIIDDALVELEMIAMGNPKDLKKQLVVEFVGEQGIDEGGVSKEFFQLVVEQIFKLDYGMFTYQEDTNTVWFNPTSFENEAQFTLIGIVLGLAIYNNIILAVNFPMVVYRKLMGVRGSFADLQDWNPVLYRSMQSMLDYQEMDMEEVFMQTFQISYKDIFGNTLTHDLKPNGDSIYVNQDNKQEFVDLYSDYLLNKSIVKQFRAFRNGFQMVTDESPLHLLFRPEEVEQLVCGSKRFDFYELEKSTEYECGYTDKSQIIVDFWSIVHELPMESKKKLLEFTTGSDRVPVGGLSRLKLVIARNGPDSDRLPTSHTCFNVLLLPEYSDKAKLEDRLLKAINYSKGFGML